VAESDTQAPHAITYVHVSSSASFAPPAPGHCDHQAGLSTPNMDHTSTGDVQTVDSDEKE
jgi:hypothetical protein